MKKRYMMILLAAAMLSMTACGSKGAEENTEESTEESTEDAETSGESEELPSYDPVLYEDLTSKIISMGEYKGLEAVRTVAEVTDEDVQSEADSSKKDYSELLTVDREAQMGDTLLIDFTGYVDGQTSDELSGTEYSLELGSGDFVPGFEEQLVGVKADEDVEVNVTFPEDYYEEMAGKDARFEVHVQSVQTYDTDAWDDAFIKENFGYENEEEMLAAIRENLEQDAEKEADENVEYELVQSVLDSCEFDIQDADIDLYTDQMLSEYETYASMYGTDLATFLESYMGTTEEALREMFHDTASFRVQMTLAFHEIAKLEGLEVSEEEYQEMLGSLAEDYGYENTADVEKVYSREMIEEQLIQEKAIDLIWSYAVIS